jgi:RimJ/RimL family protein N-acetyltransferase
MAESVIIEPIARDDHEGIFRLVNAERERLLPWFPITCANCKDARSARSYIKELMARMKRQEHFCFVMRDYEGGDPIGLVFLNEFDRIVNKCEAAYFISSIYERKGLTTLGVYWAVDYAFTRLGMQKVYARVVPENIASCKVLENCGFQREGLLRRDFRSSEGKLHDVYIYSNLL